MVVLIIAPENDLHAHAVRAQIEREHKIETIIMDFAGFGRRFQIGFQPGTLNGITIRTDQRTISGDQIHSVWCRRIYYPEPAPEITTADDKIISKRDSKEALKGLLYAFAHAGLRCVNDPRVEPLADNKPLQLQIAQEVGLSIPQTLVSNDPRAAESFFSKLESQSKRIAYKGFGHLPDRMIATQILDQQARARLQELEYSPVIFQEYVKGEDIRVNVIGDQIFGARIANCSEKVERDWRLQPVQVLEPISIPNSQASRILELIKRLQLGYAACDFKLTPEGDWVFLEVNTRGQFLFAEISAKQEISRAVADLLVRPKNNLAMRPAELMVEDNLMLR